MAGKDQGALGNNYNGARPVSGDDLGAGLHIGGLSTKLCTCWDRAPYSSPNWGGFQPPHPCFCALPTMATGLHWGWGTGGPGPGSGRSVFSRDKTRLLSPLSGSTTAGDWVGTYHLSTVQGLSTFPVISTSEVAARLGPTESGDWLDLPVPARAPPFHFTLGSAN